IASGLIPEPFRRNSPGSGRGSFRSTAKPRPRRWRKAWSCRSTVRSSAPWGWRPTPAMGRISSGPPGVHTGNLDNKDLVAGTTLYMPVHAPGALFSAGDAHAAQGHGEVDLTAVETGLRGKFQFIVRKDMKLTWPRAETPTHWIVMGLHPDLDEGM